MSFLPSRRASLTKTAIAAVATLAVVAPLAAGPASAEPTTTSAASDAAASGSRVLGDDGAPAAAEAQTASARTTDSRTSVAAPEPTTSFRVSTFNVLGADHTAPGGNRRGYETGEVRIGKVVQILANQAIDVVGMQEFQAPQAAKFAELVGTSWQTYPGLDTTAVPPGVDPASCVSCRSISWRTDVWTMVEQRTIAMPYFSGGLTTMPYVLLRNNATGRQVWFFNSHNPADTRGNAAHWRAQGFAMEAALFNELRAAYPGTPVISLGDKNDRANYFCAVAPVANMWSANNGYVDSTGCKSPASAQIDWIMGTTDVFFNGYTRLQDDLVKSASDHPIYFANAVLPPAVAAPTSNVVVIAVAGLSSAMVKSSHTTTKELARMAELGASTMNARTTTERTTPDANLMSLLTGRKVSPSAKGHGVGWKKRLPKTTHAAAGEYISSVFDLTHNNSRRTSFASSRKESSVVLNSWNAKAGGLDPYGPDNGTAKIDQSFIGANDAKVVSWWRTQTKANPAAVNVIELSDPLKVGQKDGFASSEYRAAVTRTDQRIARIRRTVNKTATMGGNTMIVVVGTGGVVPRKGKAKTSLNSYRVPMLVTGPGVQPATDLYWLNAVYANPKRAQVGYGGAQPIRAGDVANLITRALALPPVPGATMGATQQFQAYDPLALTAPPAPRTKRR